MPWLLLTFRKFPTILRSSKRNLSHVGKEVARGRHTRFVSVGKARHPRVRRTDGVGTVEQSRDWLHKDGLLEDSETTGTWGP